MIRIDKVTFSAAGYGTSISGNGGEEELFITISPSQAGRGPLVAVAMSVDGGAKILREHTDLIIADADYASEIEAVIKEWQLSGIQPSKAEEILLDQQRKKAMTKIKKTFYI